MRSRSIRVALGYGAVAVLLAVVVVLWIAARSSAPPTDVAGPAAPATPSMVAPAGTAAPATPPVIAPAGAALLVGAGDIASCSNDHDELTARLVESFGDVPVFRPATTSTKPAAPRT